MLYFQNEKLIPIHISGRNNQAIPLSKLVAVCFNRALWLDGTYHVIARYNCFKQGLIFD